MLRGRREREQFHRRPNIVLYFAAVLFALVCASVFLMNGMYARYRTTVSMSDSARVIAFGDISITETGDFAANSSGVLAGKLLPGKNMTKNVSVNFTGSESSVYVFVEATLPAAKWTADAQNDTFTACNGKISWDVATAGEDGWTYVTKVGTDKYIYVKELDANEELTGAAAQFIANGGQITVSQDMTRTEYKACIGDGTTPALKIGLRAYVTQSNGFENAAEAWTALSGS